MRLRPAPDTDAKALHGGFIPGRSCAAVAGDVLFLTDKDGVLRLDAETGKELGRVAGPKQGGQVKLKEGSLVLVGETVKAASNGEAVLKTEDAGMIAVRPGAEFFAER